MKCVDQIEKQLLRKHRKHKEKTPKKTIERI